MRLERPPPPSPPEPAPPAPGHITRSPQSAFIALANSWNKPEHIRTAGQRCSRLGYSWYSNLVYSYLHWLSRPELSCDNWVRLSAQYTEVLYLFRKPSSRVKSERPPPFRTLCRWELRKLKFCCAGKLHKGCEALYWFAPYLCLTTEFLGGSISRSCYNWYLQPH